MKLAILTALAVAGLATEAPAHDYAYTFQPSNHVIVVSCYRGPWKQVIWDHPNAKFIDSLVAIGYDFPTSEAIANRICRDQNLVFDPEGLKATMKRIYMSSPVSKS
ncbi:hypothetical protein GLS40_14325 [Pseudooceanicola sp. 216_PA32_1]|jgi:hypothetical protein|uniref:Uncharacterized protein n=1 Tax=Pseudooceanicola pacificus TaxID=2676438 RepID=A0A844WEN4_9RHOB|nr:hypothetical protein [Pseudooceanicola pacificus]MWB79212.1 hypothetical protein [Pseudooceanicola pacificus]